ncbi:MAG: shikimate kinase [Deltaproteobacteria bacterium]|nr:MAG: shikimate kinase [Deltaproteobacteria bacterium]
MREKRRGIVITGFMGTGKSTVGVMLARRLRREFVDLDSVIEEVEGKSIRDIFEEKGELYFRDVESRCLNDVLSRPGMVVATGGGAVIREENRRRMREYGFVVCLTASPAVIEERVRETTVRPLLLGGDFRERVRALLEERKEFYRDSDLTIVTDGKMPVQVVDEILSHLEGLE